VVTSIFNSFSVIFSDLWYDQGREEISSITCTQTVLQSRQFGEITMAKNTFAVGDTPPHTLSHSKPSAPQSSRLWRLLLSAAVRPCFTVQKSLIYTMPMLHASVLCTATRSKTHNTVQECIACLKIANLVVDLGNVSFSN